jgi:parvulin-like peptidyl-prolyl isomerase
MMKPNFRSHFFRSVIVVALMSPFVVGAKPETEKKDDAKPAEAAEKAEVKGAAEDPEDPDEKARQALPVVNINDESVTVGFLEKAIQLQQVGMVHRQPMNRQQAREFLDRMVDSILMADEAKRRGYDKNPEVIAITKNKLASLMHRHITDEVGEPEPSEEDLKKYYDEHYDTYHKPEKVRARHILIKDKAKAQSLLKKALENDVKQQEFRKMAKEVTEDEHTQKHGGDLGFFTRPAEREEGYPEVDKKIVEAAFKLEKNGDVYPKLVETDKGFHIIMRTGHRKKMDLSFEDSEIRIKTQVGHEMRKAQVEERINKLKKRYPVEIFEENLKHVVIDLSQTTGPDKNKPAPKK